MGAVWFRFRVELRSRWRGLVAVALLAGAAGGVAVAAITGARRTDTAYERLAADTEAYDVLVNPDLGTFSKLRPSDVLRLPQVAEGGRSDGVSVATTPLRNMDEFRLLEMTTTLLTHGGAYTKFGRLKLVDGRLPDPRTPDEVLVDSTVARRQHVEVGDDLDGLWFSDADLAPYFSSDPASIVNAVRRREVGRRLKLRVVGIGVQPDQIVVDEGFDYGLVLLTPAFQAQHDVGSAFFGVMVRLRGGAAAIPAFRRDVERLVPDEAIAFQTAPVTAAKFDRAIRPDVGALTIFAVVIALTGLLLVGQAIARQSFIDGVDTPTLHALGLGRSQLFGVSMLRAGFVAVAGATVTTFAAFGLSALTPIGPARTAEPDPGLAFDGLVLGAGAIAVLLIVLALAVWPAWRHAATLARTEHHASPLRFTRVLADAGAPITATTGVRMALEPGRGRTAVPVRTTIATLGLAVMLVVGSVGVVASIDHLVATPRLFGWNWDVEIEAYKADASANAGLHRRLDRLLERSGAVRAWSTVVLSDVRLQTGSVPAFGIDPRRDDVTPSVADGRLPRRDDEIALGARTLSDLDASIGSIVPVRANDGTTRRLTIVGQVVLPGLGTYPGSDKTALGEGVVVTERAIPELGPDFKRRDYVVDFAGSAASRERVIGQAEQIMGELSPIDGFDVSSVLRPSDILSYERVRTTPIVLAGVLAMLAVATLVHALVTTVRRRRRDLALLTTLGFTRKQIAATVMWQAATVASFGLLFGIPVGIALGRTAWHELANDLGTVAEPVVPGLVVLLIAVGAVAVTNVAALVPARLASRLRPATALRSE